MRSDLAERSESELVAPAAAFSSVGLPESPKSPKGGRALSPKGLVRIRLAETEADIDALMELGRLNHAESSYANMPLDEAHLRQRAREALRQRGRYALLLAERDGRAVGMLVAFCDRHLLSNTRGVTVYTWFVKPDARGGMAAIKLLRGVKRWAGARDARNIYLNVTSGVDVRRTDRLLKRLGFQFIGGNYALGI